jgi:uncharacterized membrane-anchored protein YhcB (DUF1043 family)
VHDLELKVHLNKKSDLIELIIQGMDNLKYHMAEKMAHELLANIYEEYKRFCEYNHLHYNTAYKLEKTTKFNHPCKLTFL